MSISIAEEKEDIYKVEVVKAEETKYIFSKSLLGATIQDSSIREKRNNSVMIYLWTLFLLI